MPLDPIVSLSVALAEAPGSCACLLGAGVSVDAGAPTAWDIRQEGFRSLYRQETGSDETPTDEQLTDWLKEQGHEDLDYSSLLNEIAPDAAVRRELLASYFKGTEPGQAHERLAGLAAGGFVRVFITTNFDRLLEAALVARGLEPVIVSDDATLAAAPRREHAPVFIVKAHGDYMQETIRNTPSELSELPPGLTAELRDIVDHYGLLVIGWKGSDPALAKIVRARSPSRYGAWWLSRIDPPSEPGRTLVEAIGARLIVRPEGAGEFLAELDRRLTVYQAHDSGNDPGSVHDQVLEVIRRANEVELTELLRRERYAFESAVETVRVDYQHQSAGTDAETFTEGWGRLSAATDRRLASLIPLSLYRPELLAREMEGHASWASNLPVMTGPVIWGGAWRLPLWIIAMALGGFAVRMDLYATCRPLLSTFVTDASGYREPLVTPPDAQGQHAATVVGAAGPEAFPAWRFLIFDLQRMEWLETRYPEWLRRENEPTQALISFSMLITIAMRLQEVSALTAWWRMNFPAAMAYARQLHREPSTRRRVADAIGLSLEAFDEQAPTLLETAPGAGWDNDAQRVAAILRSG